MVLGCPDGRRKKRSGARRVFAVFEDGLPACKKLQAGKGAKKDISTPPKFQTFCGRSPVSGCLAKNCQRSGISTWQKRPACWIFEASAAQRQVRKALQAAAEAVRAPGKNSQFAGRSKFRDVCRHSGEVSQTPSEAVCRPANAPIPPKFQTFCGAGRRFRNASQKTARGAA